METKRNEPGTERQPARPAEEAGAKDADERQPGQEADQLGDGSPAVEPRRDGGAEAPG
jgi:hypothetical protein